MLERRSTGALEGIVVLYFTNIDLIVGYLLKTCNSVDLSVKNLHNSLSLSIVLSKERKSPSEYE